MCDDGVELLESELLILVEGAENSDQARDILSKFSP